MNKISIVGLDLAKNVIQMHAISAEGSVEIRKKLRRSQVLSVLARLESCMVAMEACSGAHYWGREISKLGHEVRLIHRIRCELPHGFGRDYGTTSFWSGSCVALFHIEFPDFWDDQRDIVIGVFQKGGGIGSGSWRSEVWAAEFVGAMQKNWE